jgi:glycosyltransferase involved in cell wall biosynthesis
MKALFIVHNLTLGGIQTQALALAKHLQSRFGFNIDFQCVGTSSEEYTKLLDESGISYKVNKNLSSIFDEDFYHLNFAKKLQLLLRLRNDLAKEKYDVVFPYSATKAINFIYKFAGIKLSFWFERCGHDNPKPLYIDFYQKIIRKNNPVFVANSEHGAKALSIIHHKKSGDVVVIKNKHVKNDAFQETEKWESFICHNDRNVYFVMIANFFSYKDQETVIKAWGKLKQDHNCKLILAGLGGPKSCHDKFHAMRKLTDTLALNVDVLFLGSVKNTTKLLSIMDVGILSTNMEGCPNAVLDYMSASLPVIATNIAGNIEVLPKQSKDYIFNLGDEVHCSQLVMKLAEDKKLRIMIGKENRQHYEREFESNLMFEKYEKVLRDNNIIVND